MSAALSIATRIESFSSVAGGVLGRAEREEEIGQPVRLAAELRVAERDLALGARREPGRRSSGTCPCRPIPAGPGRGSCGRSLRSARGLPWREQLGGVFLAVDQQRQLVDGAVVGQREDERDFHLARAGVLERLGDLDLGDRVAELGVDLQRRDAVARLPAAAAAADGPRQAPVARRDGRRPASPGPRRRRPAASARATEQANGRERCGREGGVDMVRLRSGEEGGPRSSTLRPSQKFPMAATIFAT